MIAGFVHISDIDNEFPANGKTGERKPTTNIIMLIFLIIPAGYLDWYESLHAAPDTWVHVDSYI